MLTLTSVLQSTCLNSDMNFSHSLSLFFFFLSQILSVVASFRVMEDSLLSASEALSNSKPAIKKFVEYEVTSEDDSSDHEPNPSYHPASQHNTDDESSRESTPEREEVVAEEPSVTGDQETNTVQTVEMPAPKLLREKQPRRKVPSLTAMYDRSQRQAAATENRLEKIRLALEASNYAEYTFQPKISARAKRLQHSSSDFVESVEKSRARLRQHLLDMSNAEEYSFSPQICKRSSVIVQKNRAQNEDEVSVVDRLYHSNIHTEQPMDAEPKSVRTQKEIEQHVSSLYQYEERRKNLIAALRDELQHSDQTVPPVNLREVVTRLYTTKVQVNPSAVYEKVTSNIPEKYARETEKYLQSAKIRSLQKWFSHFSNGKNVLSETDLIVYEGMHMDEKQKAQLLLQRHSNQSEWSAEEFIEILSVHDDSSSPLWKVRICSLPDDAAPTDTFTPKIDPVSSLLIERKNESGCLPAHDRLFLAARDSQLKRNVKLLEKERQELHEEEKQREKKRKLCATWRRLSKKSLLDRNSAKAEETIKYLENVKTIEALEDSETVTDKIISMNRDSSSVEPAKGESCTSSSKPPCTLSEPQSSSMKENPDPSLPSDNSANVLQPEAALSVLEQSGWASETSDAIEQLRQVLSESPEYEKNTSCDAPLSPIVFKPGVTEEVFPPEAPLVGTATEFGFPATVGPQGKEETSPFKKKGAQTDTSDFLLKCSLCSGVQPISYSQPSMESKRKLKNLGKALYRKTRNE